MIKINSIEIVPKRFPDGTYCLLDMPMTELNGSAEMQLNNEMIFNWNFESEEEIIFLWYLINHCKAHFSKQLTYILYMRYVPGARMDRVKNKSEVFTLKHFAKLINAMEFDQVILLDPHSNVATSLFENGIAYQPITTIEQVISIAEMDGELVLYFPDEGAMKRYKDAFPKHKFLYGEKKRDWETGKILGLDLRGNIEEIENPVFLMIDDICSYGGTFYHSAKALKDAFPNSTIYSYSTHTENYFPTLDKAFDDALIKKHFTTNSIYNQKHPNINTFLC